MAEQKELEFVGKVRRIEFNKGPGLIKISFNKEMLDMMKANLNSYGWINLNLRESKTGPYLSIDTWTPDYKKGGNDKWKK